MTLYSWHRSLLAVMLPDLENLPASPEGEARARRWFDQLLGRFIARGLKTPAQQKNRVVDTRNAIREHFGDDHPALAVVGFDEATWQAINLAGHDRTEARNEHQRLLRDPEAIVAKADGLLSSARFEDLAVGLAVAIGRRISELLDSQAKLEPVSPWSVRFTGQRKHRGDREGFSFEIPTLVSADKVLDAWKRLRVMLGSERLDPQRINARYSHGVNRAADAHFRGLVPPRLPAAPTPGEEGKVGDPHGRRRRGDALYLHLFRAVYATIAVHWFCPPRVNRLLFKAEIQGHRQIIEAENPTMRRSYAASRHYDDYQIADASGHNIDGRQGIKLGKFPGLEVLAAFGTALAVQPSDDAVAEDGDEFSEADGVAPEDPAFDDDAEESDATEDVPAEEDDAMPAQEPPVTAPSEPVPHPTPTAEPTANEPAEAAAPTPPPERRPRPVSYRVHVDDRPRLDGFRAHPEQSQADNLHGVLEAAAEAEQLREQVRVLAASALRVGTLESERDEARMEAGRLRALVESHLAAHASPAAAATGPMLALAQELLDVAAAAAGSPLQPRLMSLASRTLGVLRTGGGEPVTVNVAGEATGRPFQQAAATSVHPPEPPSAGAPLGQPAPSPDLPGTAPGGKFSEPVRATRRGGGAAAKIERAVAAVMAHNEAQDRRDKKWALTAGAVATLTGCFRPAINRYFEEHKEEVETHNLKHHVTRGDNGARGRRGESIEEEVEWRERES